MYLPLLSCKRCRLRRQHSTSGALMCALVISLGVPIDALELGTATQHSGQPVRPGKNGHLSCRVEPSTPPLLHCRRLLPYRPLASVAPQRFVAALTSSYILLKRHEVVQLRVLLPAVASADTGGIPARLWRRCLMRGIPVRSLRSPAPSHSDAWKRLNQQEVHSQGQRWHAFCRRPSHTPAPARAMGVMRAATGPAFMCMSSLLAR